MKLTIEHLKGYLGTGLRILVVKDFRGFDRNKICELHTINIEGTLVGYPIDQFGRKKGELTNLENIKPILHPLSDLTKFREDLGFVPIEELAKMANDFELRSDYKIIDLGIGTSDYDSYDYFKFDEEFKIFYFDKGNNFEGSKDSLVKNNFDLIQKLYEWHFAVNIPEELYIDINTLTK